VVDHGAEGKTPTPEEDIRIAQQALAAGDARHAAHHIAYALGSDPTRRDWLALLNRALDALPHPAEQLAGAEGPMHFALKAFLGYACAREGRHQQAARHVLAAFGAQPHATYLDWAEAWLAQPGVAETAPPDLTARFLKRIEGRPDRTAEALRRPRGCAPRWRLAGLPPKVGVASARKRCRSTLTPVSDRGSAVR
jgi:hypothetical protein